MTILVVEDSPKQGPLLRNLLQSRGRVDLVSNLPEATHRLDHTTYDIAIINDRLADGPIHPWCQQIRQTNFDGGLIILTQKNSNPSGTQYLHDVADDFVVHPINPLELVARVIALTRRTKNRFQPTLLSAGPLKLDLASKMVTYHQTEIKLRRMEFLLLAYLMRHQYHLLTKEKLFNQIWGWDSDSGQHTVEVHIQGLRQKIDQRFHQEFIQTVYGLGYKFICPIS